MIVETGPGWALHLGDCTDLEHGLPSLGERSVDHVITDPPYEAEAHTRQRRVMRGGKLNVEALTFAPISEELRNVASGLFAHVSARWSIVFCQAEAVGLWAESLNRAGLSYKRACVWIKPDGMPQLTGDRPAMGYESIVCAHAPGRSRWNGGGKVGVYGYRKNQYNGTRRNYHPTEKPLALMEALVRDFTGPGDLVCDQFAGSASTGVACIRLGRRFVGWERDEGFFETAVKRLRGTREQLSLPTSAGIDGKQEGLL